MTLTLTSSLQKNLPSLSVKSTDEEWNNVLTGFLDKNQSDISSFITTFDKNIRILENQKSRCSEVVSFLEEAGGLTIRARNLVSYSGTTDENKTQLAEWENWFKKAIAKIDDIVANSEFEGVNLLNGGSLRTGFDTKSGVLCETTGHDLSTKSLGIRTVDFSALFSIQNARIDIMNAIDIVITVRNIIIGNIVMLTISRDFSAQSLQMTRDVKTKIITFDMEAEIQALKKLHENLATSDSLAEPAQKDILDNFAQSPKLAQKLEDI